MSCGLRLPAALETGVDHDGAELEGRDALVAPLAGKAGYHRRENLDLADELALTVTALTGNDAQVWLGHENWLVAGVPRVTK